jgi:hypothetical protein
MMSEEQRDTFDVDAHGDQRLLTSHAFNARPGL